MSAVTHGRTHRRDPVETNVVTVGIVVVLAAAGFRAWAIADAWFFYDDFLFLQRAVELGLWELTTTPYNGHLMPAGFLVTQLNVQAAPMEFALFAGEIVGCFALFGFALLRLLTRMFGARPGILVPLVLTLFSPILIPATIWWAAAVNQLPMLLALVVALDAFISYLRDPRRRPLVVSVAALVVGLAFVERTLLGVGMLWLVALLYFTQGTLPERLRQLWTTYRPAVVTYGALVLGYLAVYVPWAINFDARSLVQRPFFEVVRDMVVTAFGAGFVGGPLAWKQALVTQSEANPSQLFLIAAWGVIGALVWTSARTRRRGLRAWLLPAFGLASNVALVSVSRALYFGPEIALDYRFQTEAALLAPLAVGLAFMPLRGAVEPSAPAPQAPGDRSGRLDTPGWAVVGCLVFLWLSAVSTHGFPLRNPDNDPQAYVRNVQRSSASHPGAQVLDLGVPTWMLSPFVYPVNTYSHMFAPLGLDLRFTESAVDDVAMFDARGRLSKVRFRTRRELALQRPGPGRPCARRLRPGRNVVPLDGPVYGIGWHVRLRYSTARATAVTLVTDEDEQAVQLPAGRHTLLREVTGKFDKVAIEMPPEGPSLCLKELEIGQVKSGKPLPS